MFNGKTLHFRYTPFSAQLECQVRMVKSENFFLSRQKTGLGAKGTSYLFSKAMVRSLPLEKKVTGTFSSRKKLTIWILTSLCRITHVTHNNQNVLALYDQASRAISTG